MKKSDQAKLAKAIEQMEACQKQLAQARELEANSKKLADCLVQLSATGGPPVSLPPGSEELFVPATKGVEMWRAGYLHAMFDVCEAFLGNFAPIQRTMAGKLAGQEEAEEAARQIFFSVN